MMGVVSGIFCHMAQWGRFGVNSKELNDSGGFRIEGSVSGDGVNMNMCETVCLCGWCGWCGWWGRGVAAASDGVILDSMFQKLSDRSIVAGARDADAEKAADGPASRIS